MAKPKSNRKTRANVKIAAKAGKPTNHASDLSPGKAPQRTVRQAGGLRASVNRGGKARISG